MLARDARPTQREIRERQKKFQRSRRAEQEYARQLRAVAKQVGMIVRGLTPKGGIPDVAQLRKALSDYSNLLRPWASAVGGRMLADVARRDASMWRELGNEMGKALAKEIEGTPTGELFKKRLAEQVELITSLPTEAAQRVHHFTIEGINKGWRADQISAEILKTGKVTESRAMLIARTEVARTATELTAARCVHAEVTHAIWRTAGDGDVRESHKKMDGKVFEIKNPPIVDGEPLLPGATFNCRCYLEPLLPE